VDRAGIERERPRVCGSVSAWAQIDPGLGSLREWDHPPELVSWSAPQTTNGFGATAENARNVLGTCLNVASKRNTVGKSHRASNGAFDQPHARGSLT
jgi:hypothetical protein